MCVFFLYNRLCLCYNDFEVMLCFSKLKLKKFNTFGRRCQQRYRYAKAKDELVLGNDILVCPVITKGAYN